MQHTIELQKGWTVEDAFEKPLFDQTKSFSRLCASHGLNPATVRDRVVKLGWTMEDALNTPCAGRGSNAVDMKKLGKSECLQCGAEFERRISAQKFCSANCREENKKVRNRKSA